MMQDTYKYKKDEVRVGTCKHTKKLVLQSFEGYDLEENDAYQNGWLCLHNEDGEDDRIEVLKFINKGLKNKKSKADPQL
jgi:hypothetical protein